MISLLIPTLNRSEFLIRLLRYYSELTFEGRIIIGDSSGPDHVNRTVAAIRELEGKIDIVYREYPGLSNAQCITHLLEVASTEYVTVLPDDDFLVPSSLQRCTQFLERTPEYNAAHGVAGIFSLVSPGAHGRFDGIVPYKQRSIEGQSAAARILDHLGDYSVNLASVYRLEAYRALYEHVSSVADRAFGGELLPCCLAVIRGKVKKLDCLYMVRQAHDARYLWGDAFDWVTSPQWPSSYKAFRDYLAIEVGKQDNIPEEQAKETIKQAFWNYLGQGLPRNWGGRYALVNSKLSLRKAMRRVPLLRGAWHQARSFLPGEENKISLPALLRPGSPYHADFMPIYRAVVNQPIPLDPAANEQAYA